MLYSQVMVAYSEKNCVKKKHSLHSEIFTRACNEFVHTFLS